MKSTYQKIHVAIFAIILSGELEGENIKNLTYGMINIDESKTAENIFIPEGGGRVLCDKDLKSEKIRDFFFDED